MTVEIERDKTGFKELNELEVDSLPGAMSADVRGVKPIRQGSYRWSMGRLRLEPKKNQVNVDGIRARKEEK